MKMLFSWLLGQARTSFYSADQSVELVTTGGKRTTLLDFVKSVTPPCWLNPFLFNGHLQSIYTIVTDDSAPIFYRRKIFEADKPYVGSFTVDFAVDPYQGNDETLPSRTTYYSQDEVSKLESLDSNPMILVAAGLVGGSQEVYLRQVLAPLVIKETGWEACVVNARGCAMSKLTSTILYNARATWDFRQAVKWLREKFPNRPLFGLGFSLGANILVNYLAEEGSNCVLEGAVVCSNPWNLEVGNLALQRTWLGKELYSKALGGNLRKLFETHADQISKHPGINVEKLSRVKYIHEFDKDIQVPMWGYPTVGAYYRDASSIDSLYDVKVPLLAINAEDDPVVTLQSLPFDEVQQNPYVVLCTTSRGGHVAWYELGGRRWFTKPAVGFLTKLAQELRLGTKLELHYPSMEGEKEEKDEPTFKPTRRRLRMYHDID